MNTKTLPVAGRPSVRPLACAVLLALTSLSVGQLDARNLDGEEADVVAGDTPEAWDLKNASRLVVFGGQTHDISAHTGSSVALNGATVVRQRIGGNTAVTLDGASSLHASGTTFRQGGLLLRGGATAHLIGSSILMDDLGAGFGGHSVGVDLSTNAQNHAILDATLIRVADNAAEDDAASGIGVRLQRGRADLINGSSIDAANTGVALTGTGDVLALRVDNSTIRSGRGAALHVRSVGPADITYVILVANGSQVIAGDGNLLVVGVREGGNASGTSTIGFTVDDSRLTGDVTFDTSAVKGTLDVLLRNKARIDGRFSNVTSATIGTDSTWMLTGDSNVGRLQLDATGSVALGDGTRFNALAVDAFVGNGGTLLFNTVLGDDSSATDKLIITGDADGQAGVRVRNAGGAGAKTDLGIELINIGGASNAQFDLIGRAVGGQYEYFLVKGVDGNWYLRSEMQSPTDPCQVDPSLPACQPTLPVEPVEPVDPVDPVPVLRPEAGAYLANQFALTQLLRHSWRDRNGDQAAGNAGVHAWAKVDSTHSRLGAVADQLELKVDRSRVQVGADLGVFDADRGRVGVMLTAAQSQARSRSHLTGYSANGKVEGGAVGVYGSWSNDALYLDASVQRGQFRNRVEGDGLDTERYDADLWQSSVEAGYQIDIGRIGAMALRLQPELQVVYTDASTGAHRETNGTLVRSLGHAGLSGRLGVRIEGESIADAGATVRPYVAVNGYRDGASNGIAFDDDVLRAGIPRNRYALGGGARVEFGSGFWAWGGLSLMQGDSGYREASAQLGVSYAW